MMMYNLLRLYQSHLEESYSKETARTYTQRLTALFVGQSLTDTLARFDIDKALDNLSRIKYKNHFAQAKNALLHFCEFQNIPLEGAHLETIALIEKKTKRKYRKQKPYAFKRVQNTINHLRNQKLKLSYQTLLKTGLRVSELAQITPSDCLMSADEISFSFLGKGKKQERVTVYRAEDKLFFARLKNIIDQTGKTTKVFYSADHLHKKAKEYGFKCHDLRRVYAKREYQKTKSKSHVKAKLRHANIRTTNIYLRSRIKI